MADERSVIDALSDESKAVAINDLVAQITRLTDAARAATQNLNKVRGERAELNSSGGLTGALARRIKDSQVNEARSASASIYSEIQAARLRMVNLTGSRVTNFRRREGESDAHASLRLRGLTQQYGHALGVATRYGATAAGEYIDSGEVSNTAREFRIDPNAERFRYQEPDRAAGIVKAFFGSKMQKFATLGGKYFSMANPLMQKARPFFGHGGFTPLAGLRSLGPIGMLLGKSASTAEVYTRWAMGVFGKTNSTYNSALLSGLNPSSSLSFGIGLGAFGGNQASGARLTGSIANTLGGMRYGMGGGNLVAAARMFGLNLMGSGAGGLATTEEILMRMSELMANANGMQKEQLVFMASQMGLSADMVRAMQDGPEKFAERMHANDAIGNRINTPEAIEAAEKGSLARSKAEASKQAAEQVWANGGVATWLTNVKRNYWDAITAGNGAFWDTIANVIGVGVNAVGAVIGATGIAGDVDAKKKMYREKRLAAIKAGKDEEAAMWAKKENDIAILSSEGMYSTLIQQEYDDQKAVIPETVSDSGGGGYITIEPASVKIEATVNTSASTFGGAAEDFGNAVNPAIQSGLRQKAKQLIGAER